MADIVGWGVRQNLLQSIVANDGAQHLMTVDQFLPSRPKPAAINTGELDLDVNVAANVTEFEIVGATEPIGPLQIGQGKRFVTGRRGRYNGRRGFCGFGSDPLPRPPVFVEDFAHAPLPPPEKPLIAPCRQGVAFYLAFRLTGQPPKSALASEFRVRTVDVRVIFASLMVVHQIKKQPPSKRRLFGAEVRSVISQAPHELYARPR